MAYTIWNKLDTWSIMELEKCKCTRSVHLRHPVNERLNFQKANEWLTLITISISASTLHHVTAKLPRRRLPHPQINNFLNHQTVRSDNRVSTRTSTYVWRRVCNLCDRLTGKELTIIMESRDSADDRWMDKCCSELNCIVINHFFY